MYFVVLWVVPVFQENRMDAFLDVNICFCREFAYYIDLTVSSHCLHGYPRVWILLETGIEYDIGYLVAEFIWVCRADTFSGFVHKIMIKKY